jgi:hypothetical protein
MRFKTFPANNPYCCGGGRKPIRQTPRCWISELRATATVVRSKIKRRLTINYTDLYKQNISWALPKLSTVMLLLNTTASTSAQGTCSRIAAEVKFAALKSSLTLAGEIMLMWSHTGRKILQSSIIEKRRSRCAGEGGCELNVVSYADTNCRFRITRLVDKYNSCHQFDSWNFGLLEINSFATIAPVGYNFQQRFRHPPRLNEIFF